MKLENHNIRPNCEEILAKNNLWAMNANEFNFKRDYENIFNSLEICKSSIYCIINLRFSKHVLPKIFFNKLEEFFKGNIDQSYVTNRNVIIVTKNGKVYEFERNFGRLNTHLMQISLSDDENVIKTLTEKSIVQEMSCYKNIVDFKINIYFTLMRTTDGKAIVMS